MDMQFDLVRDRVTQEHLDMFLKIGSEQPRGLFY